MSGEFAILFMFVALLVGISLGGHLGLVLGGIAVIVGFLGWGPQVFGIISLRIFDIMTSYIVVAVPLFIFMGCTLEKSGLGEYLFSGIEQLLGPVRGGLALGVVIVSTVLAACTGIVPTAIVSAGVIGLPPMLKRGYSKSLAFGTIAAGGALGIIIPPSVMLVLYGAQASVSVGKLFAGAIFPGLCLSLSYLLYISIICFLRPQIAPAGEREGRNFRKAVPIILKGVGGVGLLIACVLGTIILGIATPTEASGVGALGSVVLAVLFRRFSWGMVRASAIRTVQMVGMIGMIFVGALSFSAVITGLGGTKIISNLLLGLQLGPWGTLAIMMLILLVMGMFLDWLAILLICLPVYLPIAAQMGWDPIWFAIVVCVNLQMAFLTPPFGYALFFVKAIAPEGTSFIDIYKGCYIYVLIQMAVLTVCIVFPQLILWLPNLLIK